MLIYLPSKSLLGKPGTSAITLAFHVMFAVLFLQKRWITTQQPHKRITYETNCGNTRAHVLNISFKVSSCFCLCFFSWMNQVPSQRKSSPWNHPSDGKETVEHRCLQRALPLMLGIFRKNRMKKLLGKPPKKTSWPGGGGFGGCCCFFLFFFSGKIFRTASNRRQKGCWKKTYQSFGALAFESWHEQKWWCSFHFHFGVRKSGSIGISFPEDLRTLPMFRIHIRCRGMAFIMNKNKPNVWKKNMYWYVSVFCLLVVVFWLGVLICCCSAYVLIKHTKRAVFCRVDLFLHWT